jgi:hypothetical protein
MIFVYQYLEHHIPHRGNPYSVMENLGAAVHREIP